MFLSVVSEIQKTFLKMRAVLFGISMPDKKEETVKAKPEKKEEKMKVGVNIGFNLDVSEQLKTKAPLLIILLLVFFFASIMFSKMELSFSELFDFQRIAVSMQELVSISAILFYLLMSIAFAISAYFGIGLNKTQALLAGVPILIAVVIASIAFPKYALAFVAYGIAVSLAALFTAGEDKAAFSRIWTGLGHAFLILLILVFVFTYIKVQGERDRYFDDMLTGVASYAPQLQGSVKGALADTIENMNVSGYEIPRETAEAFAKQQYDAQRDSLLAGLGAAEKTIIEKALPAYDSLDQKTKDTMTDAGSEYLKSNSDLLKKTLSDQIRKANVKEEKVTPEKIKDLKKQILGIGLLKTIPFYEQFGIVIAFLVLPLVSMLNFFMKIIASMVCFLLVKMS